MVKNVFENISVVKKIIQTKYKNFSEKELYVIIDHIARYEYKQRKNLSEEERVVRDILFRANYKPKAVRFWFLVFKLPRHLQMQIKQNKITYNKARKLYAHYRVRDDDSIEQQILKEIRSFIYSLQNREVEDGYKETI